MVNFSNMPSVGRMAVVAGSLMSMANAHMYIAEPKPLQGYSPKDPLDKSGSNWPCHGAPLPTSGGQKMAAGENFDLKLELGGGGNTAVHGGGSCQLAILYDTEQAADPSAWKVIYSIEGGCPANAKGNLNSAQPCESDDSSECVHSWEVPMPKGVESGNAILSWTWFNVIGQREMYQNCVNVDITGGTGDEMDSFPAMYVANIGSASDNCETTEGENVQFPQPGEYVTSMIAADSAANHPIAAPTCGGGKGGNGGSKPSGYSGSSPTSAPASSAPASSEAQPTQSGYSAPKDVQSGIESYDNQKGRQTQTQVQTTFATSASRVAPSSAAAAVTSAAPAPTGYSSGSGANSTSSDDSVPCSEDGALVCIGDDSFGICDHGAAVPRQLSAGTVCKDGVIGAVQRFRRHVHGVHKH